MCIDIKTKEGVTVLKKIKFQSKKSLAIFSVVTLILTMVCALGVSAGTETSTNILTTDGITGGTQSITAYRLSGVDCSDLWNMTFDANTYANATIASSSLYIDGVVENLVDGKINDVYNANTQYVKYDYDYAPTSAVALQRRALLVNLGGTYNLDAVQIYMGQQYQNGLKDHAVYDCSVYAGNTAVVTDLLQATNFVTNYTSSVYTREANIALTGTKNVQYVLIVFNKISNDVGCTNTALSVTTFGSLRLGEIAVSGTPYVAPSKLLTTEGLTAGSQSVTAYRLSGVDCSDLWDMTFTDSTYASASASVISSTIIDGTAMHLVDGTPNGYTTATGRVKFDYAGTESTALLRRALLVDLGGYYTLDAVRIDMAKQWVASLSALIDHAVYDCSVYAGNTATMTDLLQATNFVTNYTTTEKSRVAEISLAGTENVRYVAIVFNKLSGDPGAKGSSNEYQYGENALPASYDAQPWDTASLHISEITLNGWVGEEPEVPDEPEPDEPDEPELTAPTTLGATININSSSEIRFGSKLPAEIPQGYTIVEYGTLVIPNQLLATDAELLYDTQSAAKAVETGAAVAGAEFTVDLKGSSQGVYPGVKFAARSYVIYEDANGQQTTIYGETKVRSVWAVAQEVAAKLIENKASLTLSYTGVVTDQVSAQDVLAAKSSGTAITKEDVYAFVCQNVAAVEALQNVA